MQISTQVIELRTKLQLSQNELAINLGCSQQLISAIENNTRKPSYDILKKIISYAKRKNLNINFI